MQGFSLVGRAFVVGLIALLVLGSVKAQHFVFVSDRGLRSFEAAEDGLFYLQNDLFIYRDGSEVRLTRSLGESEYDPSPSLDASRIAYAVTPVGNREDATWEYRVLELPLGRPLAAWPIPHSRGMTRPAGGFPIVWLDEQSFLAQVPDSAWNWEIHRFSVGRPDSERIASGFGIHLSPDRTQLATEHNGLTRIVDLASGESRSLAAGEPLGWHDNERVFVARPDRLSLLDVASEALQDVFTYFGRYYGLRHSPSRAHYAYINEQGGTWYVSFVSSEHGELGEQSFANPVLALEWLNEERVVLTIEEMDGTKLALLDFAGNAPYLINRNGHDFAARALGR